MLQELIRCARRKNNELLGQISLLNKQLQESAAENFELRGALSALQRRGSSDKSRMLAFERERQSMLDLVEESTRAVSGGVHLPQETYRNPRTPRPPLPLMQNDWARKNLVSLRRSFDLLEKGGCHQDI